MSRFGYEFKAKGREYQLLDSDGLRLYKNKSGSWLIKNFSLKTKIPDGGIWKLAEYFLNVSARGNYEALKRIAKLIADCSGQNLGYIELDNNEPFPKPKKRISPPKKEYIPNYERTANISYTPRFASWSSLIGKSTTTYFNKFGVKKGTLLAYRVEPLECLTIPNRNIIKYQFNAGDFAFTYIPDGIGGNIKYKRPNSPNKDRKEGYIQSTGNYVFGLNQLPEDCSDKILIISAGEKDCLVINEHLNDFGIYSICFSAESVNLDYQFIKLLKRRFKGNLFTLFDNDKAGIESSIKARNKNNIPSIRIGSYVNNKDKYSDHQFKEIEFKVNRNKKSKTTINAVLNDASDIVYHLGKDELVRIVKTEISKAWNRKIKVIPRSGFVSDALIGIDTQNSKLSDTTGGGKTRYILFILKGKKIIIVPTIALVENIVGDEDYKSLDVFEFRSTEAQKAKLKQIENIEDLPNTIVTTYKSFPTLDKLLIGFHGQIDLITDEWHTLILGSNDGFMYKENRYQINRISAYKSVRFLSATPVWNSIPVIQKMPEIRTNRKPTEKELYLYNCQHVLKSAALLFNESIDQGNKPMILMDDKSMDKKLGTLLGLIDNNKVMAFNSSTKGNEVHQQIVKTGIIPDWLQGLVFTSVFKAGNNLKNKETYDIFIVNSFHPADIIQFIGRARSAIKINVHILRSINREESEVDYFDFYKEAHNLEKSTIAICNEFNTKDVTEKQLVREKRTTKRIQNLPVNINEHGKYYLCDILLSHMINNSFKSAVYQSDILLKKELKKANIIHIETINHDAKSIAEDSSRIAELKQSAASTKENQFNKFLEELKKAPFKKSYCNDIARNPNSVPIAKEAAKHFILLCDEFVSTSDTIATIDKFGTTKSKYKQLMGKIDIARLHQDKAYMNGGRKLSLIINEIYKEFRVGTYPSFEIKERLKRIFSKHEGFKSTKIESSNPDDCRKAVKVIRLFFDIESVRNVGGIRGINGYSIKKTNVFQKINPLSKSQSTNNQENRVKKLLPFSVITM